MPRLAPCRELIVIAEFGARTRAGFATRRCRVARLRVSRALYVNPLPGGRPCFFRHLYRRHERLPRRRLNARAALATMNQRPVDRVIYWSRTLSFRATVRCRLVTPCFNTLPDFAHF
jgi:hypothetical protein